MTDALMAYAKDAWEKAKPALGPLGAQLQQELDPLHGDRRTLMELALGTLPASDLAGVPFSVLLSYADHALMLRRHSPFCSDIPEDLFLHHVFYPRINSEDLVDCRPFFYEKLAPLMAGKTGREAALLINRFCASELTYAMTDARTINPLTAFSSGLGRCGEESTFAVTAFRSVGIPARQIYVPYWSHCDDNHAWVEVFTDGGWHFLGACEPEPDLDRGWFVNASGRAMVICSRTFFDFAGEGMKNEPLLMKSGICLAHNQIARYAGTARWQVQVLDAASHPVCGADVRLYVENMAEDACIAALQTDASGRVSFETGLGSCTVEAEKDGRFDRQQTTIHQETTLTCVLGKTTPELGISFWNFHAPAPSTPFPTALSPAQQAEKQAQLQAAQAAREAKKQAVWKEEYAAADAETQAMLRTAAGHAGAIFEFCSREGAAGKRLLAALTQKDLWDADPDVLSAHLEAGRRLEHQDSPLFLPYVLSPRIGFEPLSPWRAPILAALSDEEKACFAADPAALWAWICKEFPERGCRFHPVLWLQPDAALRLHAADEKGRRLLFCAVLRSLGIPARLNPVDGKAQFASGNGFCTVEEEEKQAPLVPLTLHVEKDLIFGQSFGLSRWQKGWQALDLSKEERSRLLLPRGIYRLHTVNRLPSGDQLISYTTFSLQKPTALQVQKRRAEKEDLLTDLPVTLPLATHALTLQVYAEPGAEPTEHFLLELAAAADKINALQAAGLHVQLLLGDEKGRKNPTLQKLLSLLPGATLHLLDFQDGQTEALARSLYLEPGLFPLLLLTDGNRSFFAKGGYCVGSADLALRLAQWCMQ